MYKTNHACLSCLLRSHTEASNELLGKIMTEWSKNQKKYHKWQSEWKFSKEFECPSPWMIRKIMILHDWNNYHRKHWKILFYMPCWNESELYEYLEYCANGLANQLSLTLRTFMDEDDCSIFGFFICVETPNVTLIKSPQDGWNNP